MPNIEANDNKVNQYLHVVAAVIYDSDKAKILIAKRPENKHQGGKWEFPGGKVEVNESVAQALHRELDEELGIQVLSSQPLIQIRHRYADKSVFLDVYEVTRFSDDSVYSAEEDGAEGNKKGKEGQVIHWVKPQQLSDYTFPEANLPILRAIDLPPFCVVTPEPPESSEQKQKVFLESLDHVLKRGIKLIQFRAKQLSKRDYLVLASKVIEKAHDQSAKVILNSPPTMFVEADGLHLTSTQLMAADNKLMLAEHQTLSASCHNVSELEQAGKINADFVLLSPVNKTSSHPQAAVMGWEMFQQLVNNVNLPVYALGGVGKKDLETARLHGAQGIAAITGLWKE